MFSGCYLLMRALALQPGETGKLIALIAVLNVYEALLIGLALFLIVRRGLARDGRLLLWLEAAFLVDVTLLGSELNVTDIRWGAPVSAVLLVLAVFKIRTVARVLGVPVAPWLRIALGPIALLLAAPAVLAALAQARLLSVPIAYLSWWLLALLVVTQAVEERHSPPPRAKTPAAEGAAAFCRALTILPLWSAAYHLTGAAWVQSLPAYGCFFGAFLVALGIRSALLRAPSKPWAGSVWLPPVPELLSVNPGGMTFSPLRSTLAAAGLAYLLAFHLHRRRVFAWGASLCFGGTCAGHSVPTIVASIAALWRAVTTWPGRVLPRTTAQWGILAVASSFVLLALGALASLFRPRPSASATR